MTRPKEKMETRGNAESGPRRGPGHRRSDCPIACALDIVGDRWTLLVIRDLFAGKRRYGEFLASSEGITTNILADRLKRLERAGLVEPVRYSEHPPRDEYRLTEAGRELGNAIGALAVWGLKHFRGTRAPSWFHDRMTYQTAGAKPDDV